MLEAAQGLRSWVRAIFSCPLPSVWGTEGFASVRHWRSCSYRFLSRKDYFQFANKKTKAKKRDFFEPDF